MKMILPGLVLALAVVCSGCNETSKPAAVAPHRHEHHPPHGGTPVVLGNEEYHLELVSDPAAGKLTAFVMDGELENFIRLAVPSFTVVVPEPAPERLLVFQAVANGASGETVGDTSQFEAQAQWLRTTTNFNAVLPLLAVRNKSYTNVAFNFPRGNDAGEEPGK